MIFRFLTTFLFCFTFPGEQDDSFHCPNNQINTLPVYCYATHVLVILKADYITRHPACTDPSYCWEPEDPMDIVRHCFKERLCTFQANLCQSNNGQLQIKYACVPGE